MDRHRLVEARTVVADAEEDELAEVLLSGVVFERLHLEEVARSEARTLPWAVGTIAAFAHDDLSAFETEVPSPAQVYHATRVAIRLVRAYGQASNCPPIPTAARSRCRRMHGGVRRRAHVSAPSLIHSEIGNSAITSGGAR